MCVSFHSTDTASLPRDELWLAFKTLEQLEPEAFTEARSAGGAATLFSAATLESGVAASRVRAYMYGLSSANPSSRSGAGAVVKGGGIVLRLLWGFVASDSEFTRHMAMFALGRILKLVDYCEASDAGRQERSAVLVQSQLELTIRCVHVHRLSHPRHSKRQVDAP